MKQLLVKLALAFLVALCQTGYLVPKGVVDYDQLEERDGLRNFQDVPFKGLV